MTTTYFSDSFSGTTLNTANWNYGFPGEPNGPEGWASQCYMDNSCVAVNNNLNLICEKGTHGLLYNAGMINSYGKFSHNGGWWQFQVQQPPSANGAAAGMWTACWILPNSCMAGGYHLQNWEIDFEWLGDDPNVLWMTLHNYLTQSYVQFQVNCNTLSTQPHDYTFDWAPGSACRFLFDGVQVGFNMPGSWVFNEPGFALMNTAVDTGTWPGMTNTAGLVLPNTMTVNYLAVQGPSGG